jgi:HAD superfamily hydrolase (TIGR01509 family)
MTQQPTRRHHRLPVAVVFDMDGLLLDSERLAQETFIAACRDFGFEPDLGVYRRCIGSTSGVTREILQSGLGPAFPLDAVYARWGERYDSHVHHHPVDHKPGVLEFLDALRASNTPLALATSTQRPNAEVKLRLAGLHHYFDQLICGGETARGKPHPDPYLRACNLLNVPPEECWALEDSMNGTRAALAAGLSVFQIPDLIEPQGPERELGQDIVPSLLQVFAHWATLPC